MLGKPITEEVDGLLDSQANAERRGLQSNGHWPVSSKEVMPSNFPLEKIPVAAKC
jgi:hypothetical protein